MASLTLVRSLNPYAHSFLFLFLALSPLMFLGVEGQTRCYIRNRCVNGDIAPSPIECCAKKIPDIQRNCGDRNSENCNVYFTVGGGNCTPCFYIGFQHSRIILNETGLQTIPIFVSSFGSIPSFLITANILYTNATDNVDYTFMQQYFYYPNREPFDTNIDINIRNDNVALETVEEVFLGLMMNIGYIFGQHYTTIYIKDNDVLTLSVSPTFLQVSESSIVSFAVSKDKVTAVPVNITVTPLTYQQYSNKTATNNNLPSLSSITNAPSNPAEEQDFDSAIVQLSLDTSIGAFSVSMNELVNDDNIVEDPEGLILLIESTNPDSRIRFNTQIVVIQINSDDSLVLSFDQSRLQLSENSNSVSLNIMQQTGVVSELDLSTLILSYQTIPSLIGDVVFSPPGNLVFNREGTSLNMTAIYHKTI
ncbi:PREDICTED: uncharacterized protein LOC109586261 isoform X1 [Amphimedon queenslandica]|uniref:Cadherin domain-containing protein n=1 Tax=Amphimedon queenslandica TaxID=400682 RepID=A0AAN0JMJ1_AMPQE|nr:PREDICTED: uncharacterized protein LOC109586261 isoform X1 [Amphimedon queenslandica]|eukprot:XP_019857994.1 PREDICTED: uncharacterized protein LOC109586261 isoform X1 [Amphimedon queenslandica]